ncbi:MAG: SUMF1/EgtB/PvdO family nonheme iron enzyme [Polyangiaceae bacterium]|nr:SUMF1/EgtB/PvdO family nonheme iron enzyme [Polyangiaceae bacterium]
MNTRNRWPSPVMMVLASVALLAVTLPVPSNASAKGRGCPADMANIGGKYCIDRYEAHTVEIIGKNKTRSHSPYVPVDGLRVRAVSKKGKVPQGYISRDQAAEACANAGKRLCTDDEWIGACRGKKPTTYPYGEQHVAGRCNDKGVSSFNALYGLGGAAPSKDAYSFENMNNPQLNKMKGTVAKSGAHKKCRSSYGVYDMVGNLHEWTASKSGTFRGGYYLDVHQNGDGCEYKTTAHNGRYHDYSTGFRCCK